MLKKSKGFTLIELLIVVAIIGILAALLIPNAITAMQKAKQKGTMKDIVTIMTAAVDYGTDNGYAPDYGNNYELTAGCNFQKAVAPFYIKSCPINDSWGNPFHVYLGAAGCSGAFGIEAADVGDDDVIIQSYGRAGEDEGFTYNKENPGAGLYTVTSLDDFKLDLINWNGSWIRTPRVAAGVPTT